MMSLRDQLTKEDAITVATIERGVPILVRARMLVERFHQMVRGPRPGCFAVLDNGYRGQRARVLRQRHRR